MYCLLSGLSAQHILLLLLSNCFGYTLCAPNALHHGFLSFSEWNFSDSILRELPIDSETRNYVRKVENVIFSEVDPTPLRRKVRLVMLSRDALEELDLDFTRVADDDAFRDFVSGKVTKNISLSHRYGGHQFGSWASQLGDGRAHLLGEYVNKKGRRWELQLKGSGRTPYSRRGDGRAVLRSSLREFLCSEAMHALGIPTSRAVSLVVSDDPVVRDPLYNGNVISEKAAVVLRLAPSWFRFGSFEILAENNEVDLLSELLDFIIANHFQGIVSPDSPDRYYETFAAIQNQTVQMLVKWMSYGFAHGVCNTDNFSILSITIDYGPFGFIDSYDPNFVPNLSDDTGMYALERQPSATLFNLHRLFDALKPILTNHQRDKISRLLMSFEDQYQFSLIAEFKRKLGLYGEDTDDALLVGSLLQIMEETKADFTMTFRELSSLSIKNIKTFAIPKCLWALNDLLAHKYFKNWLLAYHDRLDKNSLLNDELRLKHMRLINPRYVLRTWMAELAIRHAENGDYTEAWKVHMILQRPFEEHPSAEYSGYSNRPPDWAKSLRVSCSS